MVSNIRYLVKENRIIDREAPDVILTRYDLLNFSTIVLAKIKKIPIVLEVNSPQAYESKNFHRHSFHLPILPEFVEKYTLKLADSVIVVSKELRNYFSRYGIPKKKIFVVPNFHFSV